ncbi:gentisate 1,2-dioxygenase [Bacillus sp. J14TS2]|uniref:fumarylacetoacetate hydrolase family protein n=1 Tax=Bacillus sp. J14TS2 TaxID=2807188 RepID=UPI001B187D22|nr:fumarylacetoacetate hydrolase family protein [Bacillus sp. J14TS2]GIN70604.1 gentisate 1,2-dioxygenase [Bacillus sp. J14TS2]
MKLVKFEIAENQLIGVIVDNTVIDIHAAYHHYAEVKAKEHLNQEALPINLLDFLQTGNETLRLVQSISDYVLQNDVEDSSYKIFYSLSEVTICAPLHNPEKIICVGLNYLDHCKETGMEIPTSPIIFSKFTNALIGPNESVQLPINSQEVDYEAELAVIIGKTAKKVKEEDAMDYVFGYTILNDISARDIQLGDGQWLRGKTPDTFAPIGPYIVTKDEIADPHHLDIMLKLNGEVMQDSNTENLIFNIPFIISYLSQSMTLKPGDIIATGTPHGVGMSREPQVWLKDGDEMEITIEKIGTLLNPVENDNEPSKCS